MTPEVEGRGRVACVDVSSFLFLSFFLFCLKWEQWCEICAVFAPKVYHLAQLPLYFRAPWVQCTENSGFIS